MARDAGGGEVDNTKEDVLNASGAGVTSGALSEGRVGGRHLHRRGSGLISDSIQNIKESPFLLLDSIFLLLWGYVGLDNVQSGTYKTKGLAGFLFFLNVVCFGLLFWYLIETHHYDMNDRYVNTILVITHVIYMSFCGNILAYNQLPDRRTIEFFNVACVILLTLITFVYMGYSKLSLRYWLFWLCIFVILLLSWVTMGLNLKGKSTPAMFTGIISFVLSLFSIGVWLWKGEATENIGNSIRSMKNNVIMNHPFRSSATKHMDNARRRLHKTKRLLHHEKQMDHHKNTAQQLRSQANQTFDVKQRNSLMREADHHERKASEHEKHKDALLQDVTDHINNDQDQHLQHEEVIKYAAYHQYDHEAKARTAHFNAQKHLRLGNLSHAQEWTNKAHYHKNQADQFNTIKENPSIIMNPEPGHQQIYNSTKNNEYHHNSKDARDRAVNQAFASPFPEHTLHTAAKVAKAVGVGAAVPFAQDVPATPAAVPPASAATAIAAQAHEPPAPAAAIAAPAPAKAPAPAAASAAALTNERLESHYPKWQKLARAGLPHMFWTLEERKHAAQEASETIPNLLRIAEPGYQTNILKHHQKLLTTLLNKPSEETTRNK